MLEGPGRNELTKKATAILNATCTGMGNRSHCWPSMVCTSMHAFHCAASSMLLFSV